MIGWATLYPALLALFGKLATEDPTFVAEDRDRPRRMMGDVKKLTLAVRVLSVVGLGEDEERLEYVPAGATGADAPWADQLRSTITGQRRITLQLEADSVDNTDTGWAWAAIERVRTRLQRQSSLDALAVVEAALIRVGNGIQANFRAEGRMHSRVLLEVVIGAVVNDVDPVPADWIKHVVVSSHTEDADGVGLPPALNLVEHEIPPIPP